MLDDKKDIDPRNIKSVPIEDFNFRAPVVQDFDILAHVEEEVVVEKDENEASEEDEDA